MQGNVPNTVEDYFKLKRDLFAAKVVNRGQLLQRCRILIKQIAAEISILSKIVCSTRVLTHFMVKQTMFNILFVV